MANQSEINEAFWRRYTSEASEFFINKMLMLAPREELRGSYLGHDAPNHLMYKVDTLYSSDGHRAYEFLIEYDIYEPNVGIYYGCKGLTLGSCNHEDEIAIFNKEWEILRPEVCAVLNNSFPGKCFNHRFKLTNNANNNTYWPFWITLQEDEDILEVGMRAVRLIRNVYKRFLDCNDPSVIERREMPKPNIDADVAAFTEATFAELQKKFHIYDKRTLNKELTDRNIELLNRFLKNAVSSGILSINNYYEKAWETKTLDNSSFIRLIHILCQYIKPQRGNIPWKEISNVILDCNGLRYKDCLRTQREDALSYLDHNPDKRSEIDLTIRELLELQKK